MNLFTILDTRLLLIGMLALSMHLLSCEATKKPEKAAEEMCSCCLNGIKPLKTRIDSIMNQGLKKMEDQMLLEGNLQQMMVVMQDCDKKVVEHKDYAEQMNAKDKIFKAAYVTAVGKCLKPLEGEMQALATRVQAARMKAMQEQAAPKDSIKP
jgi:hypothetical protein